MKEKEEGKVSYIYSVSGGGGGGGGRGRVLGSVGGSMSLHFLLRPINSNYYGSHPYPGCIMHECVVYLDFALVIYVVRHK